MRKTFANVSCFLLDPGSRALPCPLFHIERVTAAPYLGHNSAEERCLSGAWNILPIAELITNSIAIYSPPQIKPRGEKGLVSSGLIFVTSSAQIWQTQEFVMWPCVSVSGSTNIWLIVAEYWLLAKKRKKKRKQKQALLSVETAGLRKSYYHTGGEHLL